MRDSDGIAAAALGLVSAACRWPDDDARKALCEERAAAVSDWNAVIGTAVAHRVEGPVADALRTFDLKAPAPVAAWAEGIREALRSQAMLEIGETLRVCEALDGIAFKVLKGAPLGVIAFGRAGLKRSWDVDILVDRADTVEAARRIAALGYSPSKPPRTLDEDELRRWASVSKHASLASPNGLEVELHWRLTSLPGMLGDIGAGGPARMVDLIGGRQVPTLADDATLAYLGVHGCSHGWSRLKWLADFSAFAASLGPSRLEPVLAAAAKHGTGESIAASFLVRQAIFGFAPPPSLALSARAREIAALSVQVIAARSIAAPIEEDRRAMKAIERARRLMGHGATYVPAYLLHRHRGSEIRALVALPRWLDWAYWLIRPYSYLRRLALRIAA